MYTHYVHAAYRGALGRELGLGTRGSMSRAALDQMRWLYHLYMFYIYS